MKTFNNPDPPVRLTHLPFSLCPTDASPTTPIPPATVLVRRPCAILDPRSILILEGIAPALSRSSSLSHLLWRSAITYCQSSPSTRRLEPPPIEPRAGIAPQASYPTPLSSDLSIVYHTSRIQEKKLPWPPGNPNFVDKSRHRPVSSPTSCS